MIQCSNNQMIKCSDDSWSFDYLWWSLIIGNIVSLDYLIIRLFDHWSDRSIDDWIIGSLIIEMFDHWIISDAFPITLYIRNVIHCSNLNLFVADRVIPAWIFCCAGCQSWRHRLYRLPETGRITKKNCNNFSFFNDNLGRLCVCHCCGNDDDVCLFRFVYVWHSLCEDQKKKSSP